MWILTVYFSCFRHHPHTQQRWRVFGRRGLGLSRPCWNTITVFRWVWGGWGRGARKDLTDLKWICCSVSNRNSILVLLLCANTSVLGPLCHICVNYKTLNYYCLFKDHLLFAKRIFHTWGDFTWSSCSTLWTEGSDMCRGGKWTNTLRNTFQTTD